MVRPIDAADNLVKMPLAEKVNEAQKAAPEADQRNAAIAQAKQQVQKQREATPTEKTDEAIIHRDKPKQEQKEEQQKKKQDDKNREEQTGGLDVTA
jgi:hypothetical protein